MHAISLPILITFIVSFVAAFSRIFNATKPFWGLFPAWLQVLFPVLPPFFAAIATGASGAQSWTDLTVVFIGAAALLLPGLPSHRSSAPLPSNSRSTPPSAGLVGLMLSLVLLSGCGLFAAAAPYLAEAAVVISDAVNAVDAAQALLPTLHLDAAGEADAEAVIARARAALAAAAATDDGAKDLTAEQLDASLVAFRAAWADLQRVFAAQRVGAVAGGPQLPVPLALRRVTK